MRTKSCKTQDRDGRGRHGASYRACVLYYTDTRLEGGAARMKVDGSLLFWGGD